MAWNGNKRTVYCRACYGMGHNRRSCPSLPPETKARYKNGDLARKCSYCYTAGHNRRSCEKLGADMANDVKQNSEYRNQIAAYMIENGLGIGALVKRGDDSDSDNNIYMIENIDFDQLTHRDYDARIFEVRCITNEKEYGTRWFSLPVAAPMPNVDNGYRYSWAALNVASSAESEDVRGMINAEWLSGKSGLDKYYEKRR